jgi:hypothetical protein
MEVPLECSVAARGPATVLRCDGTQRPPPKLMPKITADFADLVGFGDMRNDQCIIKPQRGLAVPSTIGSRICQILDGSGYGDGIDSCCIDGTSKDGGNKDKQGGCGSE